MQYQGTAPQKGAIRAPNRPITALSGGPKESRLALADATFKGGLMNSLRLLVVLAALASASAPLPCFAQHGEYDALISAHAKANNVPEALVHRIIVHESRYQPQLIGRGGTIGLMQIKLATARSLGYTGTAEGLRDPNTNLTYAVKYLAGAYRAANGDHRRAMAYYASGYYYTAKRLRQARHDPPVIAEEIAKEPVQDPANDPGAAAQPVAKP
jgi:soluble lytic murein transglycosylase-like protein